MLQKIKKILLNKDNPTLDELFERINYLLDLEKIVEELRKSFRRLNGSTLIIENPEGKILVGKANYGSKKFMLPGGAIDRGESARHAAQQETEEEVGYLVDEHELNLIGIFIQRLKGIPLITGYNFLYYTQKYQRSSLGLIQESEMSEIQFMAISEIINRKEEFGLGYMRMILHFLKYKKGIIKIPIEGRLSDSVEFFYKKEYIVS